MTGRMSKKKSEYDEDEEEEDAPDVRRNVHEQSKDASPNQGLLGSATDGLDGGSSGDAMETWQEGANQHDRFPKEVPQWGGSGAHP